MQKLDVFNSFIHRRLSRRKFMKLCLAISGLVAFSGRFPEVAKAAPGRFNGRRKKEVKGAYDIAVTKGKDPYAITVAAVETMGGMGNFVKRGDVVVVKPNIGWDRTPEQAGNTNPQVVAALVEMSFKAGAKKVKVFDIPCNDIRRCYINSGIAQAAREKGAEVFFPEEWDTVNAHFDYDSPLENWPVLREAIECDTFINCPIVKDHGLTRLTLSMKNLMGVCGDRRGLIHRDIGRKLVDLTDFIKPELTVIDAYRVLLRNGPTGGDLKDVETKETVAVSTDPTLADIYACGLVKVDPLSVSYVRVAIERNFGRTDLDKSSKFYVEI